MPQLLNLGLIVLALPLTTDIIATSVYLRVSVFEHQEALVHLAALAGCDLVGRIVADPSCEGERGYHKRINPDAVQNAPRQV